jgi:hypothetical protein
MDSNDGNKSKQESRRKHQAEADHGGTPLWRVWREAARTRLY